MGSITKLLASLSPMLAAAMTQIGIEVTEADVTVWVELVIWVIAVLSMVSPSIRAWINHRESAE